MFANTWQHSIWQHSPDHNPDYNPDHNPHVTRRGFPALTVHRFPRWPFAARILPRKLPPQGDLPA